MKNKILTFLLTLHSYKLTVFIINKYELAKLLMRTQKQEAALGDYNVQSVPDIRLFTAVHCTSAMCSIFTA